MPEVPSPAVIAGPPMSEALAYPDWRLEALGERALMVVFAARVDPAINAAVHALATALEKALPAGCELVPAFSTLTVHWCPSEQAGGGDAERAVTLEARLKRLLAAGYRPAEDSGREVIVPVCYGGELGPDLEAVAEACGLRPEAVIARHAASPHRVYMLGFTPGFPYLGGLDPSLALPRRATPRVKVPAGSVAIAGEQSGVYPLDSPGGWHLLGRTPLALFTPQATPPCLLRPGDRVRFRPITRAEFAALSDGGDA